MDPFPESGTVFVCPKCEGTMVPEFCDDPCEHLAWACAVCGWETQTACRDAKPEKRTRWFSAHRDSRTSEAYHEHDGEVGHKVWKDGRREQCGSICTLELMMRNVQEGTRRELTEAEALALLQPQPDPFAAFENVAKHAERRVVCNPVGEYGHGYRDGVSSVVMDIRDTIAEARKSCS